MMGMHFVVCKDNLFALFYLIYVCNGKNELDIIVSNLMFYVFFQFEGRKYCEHDFHVLFAPCCGKCRKIF